MSHPLSWEDQPADLLQCPILVRGLSLEGKIIEVRKFPTNEMRYVTVGNLFGSQTVECATADVALLVLGAIVSVLRQDTPLSVPEGARLLGSGR